MSRGVIIDDTEANIVYFGNWNSSSQPLNFASPEYNSTFHSTNDPNASAVITVQGASHINAFGTVDKPALNGLPVSIWTLDNGTPVHVNGAKTLDLSNRTDTISHVKIFNSDTFSAGTHTLVVNVTGVSPNGPTFYLDFIVVTTSLTLDVRYGIVNNIDPNWDYPGWTNGTSPSAYREDVSLPPEDGGTAIFRFYGTEIAVMGNLDATIPGDTAIALVNIDNKAAQTVHVSDVPTMAPTATAADTTPSSPSLYQNVEIFKTTGLEDLFTKQHSITISAPPSVASIWALDYAIYGPIYAIPSSTSTPPSGPSTSSSSPPPPSKSHSSSKAAIIGGAFGAVAGVLVIAAVAWFLYRRSKRRRKEENREATLLDIYPPITPLTPIAPVTPFTQAFNDGTAAAPLNRASNLRKSSRPMDSEGSGQNGHSQEQDAGVRLASGDDDAPLTFPPAYARY